MQRLALPTKCTTSLVGLGLASLAVLSGCSSDAGDTQGDGASDSNGAEAGDGDSGGGACDAPNDHSGEATYYTFADGSGNCSFPATPNDLMVGAMNDTDYAGSAACGRCVHIVGPDGEVDVRIVDRCPECPQGDIDLSPEAFELIAPISAGRVAIDWQYVPCPVNGDVDYHFKDGSNEWWTAVQVRNHRHGVAKFEFKDGDTWTEVPRENYNFFVWDQGMGPGPFEFRVTDVWGRTIEDTGIPLLDDDTASGSEQFPTCGG